MKLSKDLNRPLHDILPKEWNDVSKNKVDYVFFEGLQEFIDYTGTIKQIDDMKCGISYEQAHNDLKGGRVGINQSNVELIQNTVRKNLLKRGLISEDVYESFVYDIEGVAVDVAKVIEGDPQCMLKPMHTYTNYFYELYINVSYQYSINDDDIIKNMAKIVTTITELEKQHIYIKVTLVDYSQKVTEDNKSDLLTVIPLWGYQEEKTIESLASVLNERLLRKFMFAMSEDVYGSRLSHGYGEAVDLPHTIKPVDLNEVELFEEIYKKVIVAGTR